MMYNMMHTNKKEPLCIKGSQQYKKESTGNI